MAAEAVKVVIRCRPMNEKEKKLGSVKVVHIDQELLQVAIRKKEPGSEPKVFTFDGVWDDDSTQAEVYEDTAFPLVQSIMEGYNGTILAYGQTGCGKTHTMEGRRDPPEMRGIIPRVFDQVFETIGSNTVPNKKFVVHIAYLEIYNEEVKDLLGNPKERLDVKEDKDKGFFVKGLSHHTVTSADQINMLMVQGNSNRTVGETAMNATSSRSHSVFMLSVETGEPLEGSDDMRIRVGKLNLVDLAGSERQSKTHAEGARLKEANNINLSLSALGQVIAKLVKGDPHIPYRNSKLTRLLADSLGGNTKTVMIAALSPADYNYDETLSTLRYANTAKNIKNKPKINEDPKDALLRQYQDEIKKLKALLEEARIDPSLLQKHGIKPSSSSASAGAPRLTGPSASSSASSSSSSAPSSSAASASSSSSAAPAAVSSSSGSTAAAPGQPRPTAGGSAAAAAVPSLAGVPEGDIAVSDLESARQEAGGIPDETEPAPPRPDTAAADPAVKAEELRKLEEFKRQVEEERKKMEEDVLRLAKEKDEHERKARELAEAMAFEKEQLEKLASERESLNSQLVQTSEEAKAALRERERVAAELEAKLKKEQEARERVTQEILARVKEEQERQAQLAEQIYAAEQLGMDEREKLEAKLAEFQHMLAEGSQASQSMQAQAEEKLREAARQLKARRRREAQLREEKQRMEEEKLLVEEKYKDIREEVAGKTKKLKALRKRYKEVKEELKDLQGEFDKDRENMMNEIRILTREAQLYRNICEVFMAQSDVEKIVRYSQYDEDRDRWQLPIIEMPMVFPKVNGSHSTAHPGDIAQQLFHQQKRSASGGSRSTNRSRGGTGTGSRPPSEGGRVVIPADAGWKQSVVSSIRADVSTPLSPSSKTAGPARLNPMTERPPSSAQIHPQPAIRSTGASVRRPSLFSPREGSAASPPLGHGSLESRGNITPTAASEHVFPAGVGRPPFAVSASSSPAPALPDAMNFPRPQRPSFQASSLMAALQEQKEREQQAPSLPDSMTIPRRRFEPDPALLAAAAAATASSGLPPEYPLAKGPPVVTRPPFRPHPPPGLPPSASEDSALSPRVMAALQQRVAARPSFQPSPHASFGADGATGGATLDGIDRRLLEQQLPHRASWSKPTSSSLASHPEGRPGEDDPVATALQAAAARARPRFEVGGGY